MTHSRSNLAIKTTAIALALAAAPAFAIVVDDPPSQQQQQQQQLQGESNASSTSVANPSAFGGTGIGTGGSGDAAASAIGGNQSQAITDSGNSVAASRSTAGAVGNVSVGIAAARYVPPVIHQQPTQIAAPGLMMSTSPCGPMVGKTREEVIGTFIGLVSDNQVKLGWDEDLHPVADPITGALGYYVNVTLRDGTVRTFGDQVTTVAAVINVGGGRSLSLFGSGNSNAGQVGIGGNSAMQRLVLRHSIQLCDAGSVAPVAVAPTPMPPAPPSPQLPVIERVRQ